MYKLPDLKNAKVRNKKVLLRLDLDVPLSQQSTDNNQETAIEDDTRLKDSLETLNYLLRKGATVFIVGHLGRPEGFDKKFSLLPIAKWYQNKFKIKNEKLKIIKTGELSGWKILDELFLLENLRFNSGEEGNDPTFSRKLASLADIYVNDAFAVSHRNHVSIVGVSKLLPHFAGFRLKKEVETLSALLSNPKRPLVVIVGGAKIETKLPLVSRMHHFADYVLVGGKIAEETRILLKVAHEKLLGKKSVLLVADLNQDETDITLKSVENFLQIIGLAKTVVWNGPLGKIDVQINDENSGSAKLARGIVKNNAYTVVGGGDTLGFLRELGLLNKFSFVSTGGGAMLEFLSGNKLPGIDALLN